MTFRHAALILTFASCTALASTPVAQDTTHTTHSAAPQYAWTQDFKGSQIGLGGSINTGDTSSRALNSQLQLQYAHKRWKDFTSFQINYGKSNQIINQEKYAIDNQLWYYLNKKQSNFASWGITDTFDKLSSYDYELSTNLSLGRELYHNGTLNWTMQAGPGMRRTKLAGVAQSESNAIGHAQTTLSWAISPATSVSENLTADIGQPFNKFVSKASLTNKLMAHLATSLSLETDYYSKLPATSTRTKHLDTITQLNLVYSF
jgi:putative salt-induced outer membrane protein